MSKAKKITPMMQQYLAIKEEHQDAILFYRLGDFYEMFFDDAVTASRVLGITLTSRNSKEDADRIPLCGVPYHAATTYLAKLVKAGFRVAICEQIEDPKKAQGVVKRAVTRIISPGLVTEDEILDDKSNTYLAAIFQQGKKWGLSLIDISTGEFLLAERADFSKIIDELQRLSPAEILLAENNDDNDLDLEQELTYHFPGICLTRKTAGIFRKSTARETLLEHFNTTNLAGFGCEKMVAGICAAGGLLNYLQETQKTDLSHIEKISPLDADGSMMIDESSRRNLELTQTIIGSKREGSLLDVMDFTSTPMGARLLKKNILLPLQDVDAINQRLDTVAQLFNNPAANDEIQKILAAVYDLERLNSRIVLGSGNGRDLTALKLSLARLPNLKAAAEQARILAQHTERLDILADIHDLLHLAIREDSPVTLRDGGIIMPGYNQELDELNAILKDGKAMILALQNRERQKTGISNLKIKFNKVFGYFLEVSKGQLANVPDYFIRKQTLVNAERFITPELKEFEQKIGGAQERQLELEYDLFITVRNKVAAQSPRILAAADFVAWIDFFCSLSDAARRHKYVRPQVSDAEIIAITEGRHPVIERALPPGKFVPNDILLDQTENEVLIITGPNMAGKSTVLRQAALIVLMAQMGSFVPADQAEIGVVDRIFTRVGAMDDLSKAQSTFMVEMNETANILNNATPKSLVILDEIGRGTSTFDGLSIAWAVTEDLVNKNKKGVKTIFATHYHELTELAKTNERIKNYNIAVREWNDSIIFLHKILPGGTNRSYGIQVAALAGVPSRVVNRAKEILLNIEKGEFNRKGEPRIAGSSKKTPEHHPSQLNLFASETSKTLQKLDEIQPDRLSPIEALNLIYELKAIHEADN